MAWFIYELQRTHANAPYNLTLSETVYSDFTRTLERINTPIVGGEQLFIDKLQTRVNAGELFGTPEEAELDPDVDSPVSFNDE